MERRVAENEAPSQLSCSYESIVTTGAEVVCASAEWRNYPYLSNTPEIHKTLPVVTRPTNHIIRNGSILGQVTNPQNATTRRRHWLFGNVVIIEVVSFLYILSFYTSLPVIQYYIIDRIWTANPSFDKSQVLDRAADYNVYLSLSTNLVAVLPTIVYGVLADRCGRKLVIAISVFGGLAKCIGCYLCVRFDTRLEFLYVAYALDGLCGSFGTFLMGMFGMVADITTPGKHRDIRTTVATATLFVASSAATTSSGFWTRYVGYETPLIFAASAVSAAGLVLLLAIPETSVQATGRRFSSKEFLRFIEIFTIGSHFVVRRILLLCLCIFFIANYNLQANSNTIILYLEGSPFCWTDDKIAVFGGVYTLSGWIAIIVVSKVFERYFQDVTFAFIGTLCSIIGFTLQGLAYNDVMIYCSAVVSLLFPHAIPMMRSIMSRHTPASQQGSLFSGVAVIEMICATVAGVTAPYLYKLGLHFYYGLHSLVFAGLGFVAMVAILLLRYSLTRSEHFMNIQ